MPWALREENQEAATRLIAVLEAKLTGRTCAGRRPLSQTRGRYSSWRSETLRFWTKGWTRGRSSLAGISHARAILLLAVLFHPQRLLRDGQAVPIAALVFCRPRPTRPPLALCPDDQHSSHTVESALTLLVALPYRATPHAFVSQDGTRIKRYRVSPEL
jgi:hypothetical protein